MYTIGFDEAPCTPPCIVEDKVYNIGNTPQTRSGYRQQFVKSQVIYLLLQHTSTFIKT